MGSALFLSLNGPFVGLHVPVAGIAHIAIGVGIYGGHWNFKSTPFGMYQRLSVVVGRCHNFERSDFLRLSRMAIRLQQRSGDSTSPSFQPSLSLRGALPDQSRIRSLKIQFTEGLSAIKVGHTLF